MTDALRWSLHQTGDHRLTRASEVAVDIYGRTGFVSPGAPGKVNAASSRGQEGVYREPDLGFGLRTLHAPAYDPAVNESTLGVAVPSLATLVYSPLIVVSETVSVRNPQWESSPASKTTPSASSSPGAAPVASL